MVASLSLGPRSVERPTDSGYTLVGGLDSLSPARVDSAGSIQLAGSGWSLDWWIGGDDRWYFPSREATIRQRRIGGGPVLETAMRIPSGDAIARSYSVNLGGTEAVVLEIENDSPVPVALALAVRPYGLDGVETSLRIDLRGDLLLVDGQTAVTLPRTPNEFGTDSGDIFDVVSAGRALAAPDSSESHRGGPGTAAALYPVAHKTTLRFLVGGHPTSRSVAGLIAPLEVTAAPDAATVGRGWDTVLGRGGRFVLPDNGVTQQAEAARARLLGAATTLPRRVAALEPGSGRILEGLALGGAVGEVLGSLGAFAGTFPTKLPGAAADAAAIVSGIGRAARLADDLPMATELLEPSAQLTRLVEKAAKRERDPEAASEAFLGLARLLLAADQREPALELFERAGDLRRRDLPDGLEALSSLAEEASPARSWGNDDELTAARFWLGTRQLLMLDHPDSIDLLPTFPSAWRGGNLEVHGAATSHGLVSFGIRWHGYRPALLWDAELHESDLAAGRFTIRCPGLDPSWSTTEPKGETLLVGVTEELPDAPAAGESFS